MFLDVNKSSTLRVGAYSVTLSHLFKSPLSDGVRVVLRVSPSIRANISRLSALVLRRIPQSRPIGSSPLTLQKAPSRHLQHSRRNMSSEHKHLPSMLMASNKKWSEGVKTSKPSFFPETAKGQAPKVLWLGWYVFLGLLQKKYYFP